MAAKTIVTAEQSGHTFIHIHVPDIPGCDCDIWCYEDDFGDAKEIRPQPDGSVVLVHRRDDIVATTHVTPLEGAVDFCVTVDAPTREQVLSVTGVNPCWQLRRSEAFGNRGEFPHEFVPRCFLFTVRGFTPLSETVRLPDTRRPPDHPSNSPPWVQSYVPVWREHPGQPKAGWGVSPTRPVESIIGVVSRDGKHLAAFAWRRSAGLGQGWHDCLHICPDFCPDYDESANRTVSHGRLYFMRNDPNALLKAYRRDLPPETAKGAELTKRA